MTTISSEISDDLNQAANLIEAFGLWKPRPSPDSVISGHCVVTALTRVTGRRANYNESMHAAVCRVRDSLGLPLEPPNPAFHVARWSDSHSQAEVVAALREAASA